LIEQGGITGLAWPAGWADVGALSGFPIPGLVLPRLRAPEDRHYDQPAAGKLIVSDHRVAIVDFFATPAESPEDIVGRDCAVQRFSCIFETPSFLGENRHPRIDGLDDVVGSDGEAVIGGIAE
jgi:hypothetical protein